MTDVLVVGGGPIGLATAIEARLAGLSVVLIEPRTGAIDKACGEGLMPGAIPLLARLGVDPPGMPLRGVSYRQGTKHADYRFTGAPGRGVRRLALSDALEARADELGVERVVGRVTSLTQDATGVSVEGHRASWLLACDGLHSTVRRLAGLEAAAPVRGRRFGQRQHFVVEPWNDFIEVHWAANAEVYITPVSETVTGVAVLGPQRTDFAATIESIPELAWLTRVHTDSTLRGAGPFRQRAVAPSAGRVLLVGDASGYVDAITGEGLRLGFAQARAAVEAVVANSPLGYDDAWRSITREFRVLTTALVRAATSPARRGIVPLARALPGTYGSIVESLAR